MHKSATILIGALALAIFVGPPALGAGQRSAAAFSGTWSGSYGGTFHGTFTVQWTQSGSKLNGTIKLSTERSKLPLTGKVRGSSITFGTVGSAAVTYSGSVSGRSMSGKYHTRAGGGSWSAHKTSRG